MTRAAHIEARLCEALRAEHVQVVDESALHAGHPGARSGGGHFRAVVVSERFEGLRPVERQRLVYAALAEEMGREIHALSMQALTPAEWRTQRTPPQAGSSPASSLAKASGGRGSENR